MARSNSLDDWRRPTVRCSYPGRLSDAHQFRTQQTWSSQTNLKNETPISDSQQTPQQHQRQTSWINTLKSWWPELLACAISIAAAGALVIVLQNLNNKALPHWPLGLTLNTLIAFLATIARSTFVIPVTESISQAKWLWFRSSRPLEDFQAFDKASRGPWGSLMLIIKTRGSFASLMTAVIILSAFFTSTFTQSVVAYPSRLVPVDSPLNMSAVPRTSHLLGDEITFLEGRQGLPLALMNGLNHDRRKRPEFNVPTCATSNCQFPVVNSLGICTKYWNVTSALNITYRLNGDGKPTPRFAELPNGAGSNVSSFRESMMLLSMQSPGASVAEQRYTPLWVKENDQIPGRLSLLNLTIIWNVQDIIGAAEIMLYLCTQRYEVHIRDNVPTRVLIDSSHDEVVDTATLKNHSAEDHAALKAPGNPNDVLPFGGQVLHHIKFNLGDLLNYTQDMGKIPGSGFLPGGRLAVSFRPEERYYASLLETEGSRLKMSPQEVQFESLTNLTENMALSISNSLHNDLTSGQALATEIFVEVRWSWLAFMLAQIFLSMLFLAVTMHRTESQGMGVIKTDPLPALFAVRTWDRVQLDTGFGSGNDQKVYQGIQKEGQGVAETLTRTETGWVLGKQTNTKL